MSLGISITLVQRLSLITLAVADVARSRRFYLDGLGWKSEFETNDVVMIRVGERLLLSLWDRTQFESEVGTIAAGPGTAPLALAHNVDSPHDVDDILEPAACAGADLVSHAVERQWGGYSGYFHDPDGYPWEESPTPPAQSTTSSYPTEYRIREK